MSEVKNTSTDRGKTNTGRCPLCHKPNLCGLAQDEYQHPSQCWCMHLDEKIPDELLDMIPQAQRGEACICQQCIQRFWDGEIP